MTRFMCFLFLTATAAAQPNDSQTLQALLQEVKQLRQDMQGMTLVAQRVQILLHRIQLQDDLTKKAAQRYEQASARLKDAERAHSGAANEMSRAEEKLASLQNPTERKPLEEFVNELKRRVEMWSNDEARYRAAEVASGSDLKGEQAKLFELEQRLDRLEQQLESYSPAVTK